jgi:nucleotide-binding universal stress UspA family protein
MNMDLSKLKGRAAYPFETIGVAIAFSPRLEALLGEAKRLSDVFGAQLLLFHIGERTRTKEARLDEVLHRLNIDEKSIRVIWSEGNAVNTLLQLCKLNIVDLLIIGAMQRENVLKYYLGSIARQISRRAKCSVLLLTAPDANGSVFKKMVVNGAENPKTKQTVQTAVYFAEKVKADDITVVTEVHQPGLAMTMAGDSTATEASKIKKDFKEEELSKQHTIVESCIVNSRTEITEKLITGKPGFAIRQYAETKKANLLIINSPDVKYGIIDRLFTHDMEYILEDLPCNVLIVHSRVNN